MPVPHTFTNTGNPVIDATQFNDNFTWLDTGKYREFVVTGVLADGTTTTIDFTPPFSTSVGVITTEIANYTGSDDPVITKRIIGTATVSGFQIKIDGGQSLKTVDLHVRASGS